MKNDRREITSATVMVTLDFSDLGTFGPGSIYEQAREAAIQKLDSVFANSGGLITIAGAVRVSAIACQAVKP